MENYLNLLAFQIILEISLPDMITETTVIISFPVQNVHIFLLLIINIENSYDLRSLYFRHGVSIL